MEYKIDYQYMPKGAKRPQDDGQIVGIAATDRGGLVVLPNVGDLVSVRTNSGVEFRGEVSSRYFSYPVDGLCIVNIVVAEAPDQDWQRLLKE